jgi:hypothetical protein
VVDEREGVLWGKPHHDVLEGARDGMLGRVAGSTLMCGIDDRFTRAIELHDEVVVALHLASCR